MCYTENPLYRETAAHRYEAEFSPHWLTDSELGHGNVRYLGTEEMRFWKELIERYIKPIPFDKQKQAKVRAR